MPKALPLFVFATLVSLVGVLATAGLPSPPPAALHHRAPDITAVDHPLLVTAAPPAPPRTIPAGTPPTPGAPRRTAPAWTTVVHETSPPGPVSHRPSRPRAPPAAPIGIQ
ncbi:hypothetical protein [Sphaerisporangium fuscum]|uniref:hypothetical protein n=1 Tax=Sphaerisporangium fuscum TaxID=2835868 RepID=UPI001BDBDDEB|nr:hypothetical protein [Sphaerisporangium fuscum]